VPVTSALRTLRDCLDVHVTPDRLQSAIERDLHRGLFTRADLVGLHLFPGVAVPSREAA